MNYRTLTPSYAVLFFCLCGWVCVGSAIGAPADANADRSAAAPGTTTITVGGEIDKEADSLFANDTDGDQGEGELLAGQTVKVASSGQIELHVENQEVTKILKLLSLQAQRNIIASRNVAGTVSADLYGVEFFQALDAVLHANGFGYVQKGNFIYVYTAEEMAANAQLKAKLVIKVKRLNYITAKYAKAIADPLLSQRGSIAINAEVASSFEPSTSDGGKNDFAYSDILVIRDQQEHVDEIIAVIDDLDIRPKQVLIEATILRVRLTEDNAFGTDLSVVLDNNMGIFTNPLNVVDATMAGTVGGYATNGNGQSLQSTVGNVASGSAGIKLGLITKNVSVFVRALDRVSDTTVVAKPKLLVLNKQKAKLLVGDQLGYLSTTSTETATTQTVEFLDIGTELTVRPFVGEDGFIRMEIRPSISDGETISVDGMVIPNKSTNELITNVIVRSGQTVVLGGLFKEDTTVSRNQVPGIGDLPIVGIAGRGHDDHVIRSEVIFLITPTEVKNKALYAGGNEAATGIEETRIGAKTGLLPWSRTKQTAAHMRKAMEYHRRGDVDKALLYTKMALSLEPSFVDALRLKRQIIQRSEYDPLDSILKHALDALIAEQDKANQKQAADNAQQSATQVVKPQPSAPAEPEAPVAAAPQLEEPAQASAEPAVAEPVAAEPAAAEPTAVKPAAVEPVAAAPKPVTPEPVAKAEASPADVASEVQAEAPADPDPEQLSAKLLEAMERWMPGGAPAATTAAVDDASEEE